MALKIGDKAPDFTAATTEGEISFHDWLGDGWGVLNLTQAFDLLADSGLCQVQHPPSFCHPADFGNDGEGAKQGNVDIAIHGLQEKRSL